MIAKFPFPAQGFGHLAQPNLNPFSSSTAEICQHVAHYPHWVLATVVPMWAFTAFLGTWIAGRLGSRGSAIFLAFLLLAAVLFNFSMLPYPLWFKIVQPIAIAAAVVYGCLGSASR